MTAVESGPVRRAGRAVPDPIYPVWRWLTSVRNAIILITIVAVFSLVGVIIPQVPPQFVDTPALVAQHVENQRGTWGPLCSRSRLAVCTTSCVPLRSVIFVLGWIIWVTFLRAPSQWPCPASAG